MCGVTHAGFIPTQSSLQLLNVVSLLNRHWELYWEWLYGCMMRGVRKAGKMEGECGENLIGDVSAQKGNSTKEKYV